MLNADSTRLLQARDRIAAFAETTTARNVVVTYVAHNRDVSISDDYFVVKGSDELEVEILGRRFTFNVQGFFQNNDIMASSMHSYVQDILKFHKLENYHLADLYGGVGTFAIINAEFFQTVITIESFPQAIESARKNIRSNACENVSALELDAKRLKNASLPSPLTIITDPPRSGMNPRTILEINRLNPSLLIYVSCNIKQLGIDLKKLTGYKIKSAALFDFFPQTPHCEAVVELICENKERNLG